MIDKKEWVNPEMENIFEGKAGLKGIAPHPDTSSFIVQSVRPGFKIQSDGSVVIYDEQGNVVK